MRYRHLASVFATLYAAPALAAGSLDRLRAVSEHARAQASDGPSHLWVGLILGAGFLGIIGLAVFWTLKKKPA